MKDYLHKAGISCELAQKILSESQLKNELDNGRPLQIAYDYSDRSKGHFVILVDSISGADGERKPCNRYRVLDPLEGGSMGEYLYKDLEIEWRTSGEKKNKQRSWILTWHLIALRAATIY